MLKPQTKVPNLTLPLVQGGEWSLADEKPENFSFLFFYRGYHCPICKGYLRSIVSKIDSLNELGISALAISSDSMERAEKSVSEWGIEGLRVAHSLRIETARQWGLYVSKAIKDNEPEFFSEPGLFIIRPDGELYAASIQTMPFTRPAIEELISGFSYIVKHGYPGRGES